ASESPAQTRNGIKKKFSNSRAQRTIHIQVEGALRFSCKTMKMKSPTLFIRSFDGAQEVKHEICESRISHECCDEDSNNHSLEPTLCSNGNYPTETQPRNWPQEEWN